MMDQNVSGLALWAKQTRSVVYALLKGISKSELENVLGCSFSNVLRGCPLSVANLKEESATTTLYAVDVTDATSVLVCPALLGADLTVEVFYVLGNLYVAVGYPKQTRLADAQKVALYNLKDQYQAEPQVLEEFTSVYASYVSEVKASSDIAQVFSLYLMAHPKVALASYVGDKLHPTYTLATKTLRGGFGSVIDFRLITEARLSEEEFIQKFNLLVQNHLAGCSSKVVLEKRTTMHKNESIKADQWLRLYCPNISIKELILSFEELFKQV